MINYQLFTGDNVAIMATHIPDKSIDLTITSPPYDNVDYVTLPTNHYPYGIKRLMVQKKGRLRNYTGYTWDFVSVAEQLWRVTKPGGVVVWVVADATIKGSETGSSARQMLFFKEVGFRLHDTMYYQTHKPPLSHNRYEQEIEYMFVFSKGKPKTNNLIRVPSKYFGIDNRRNGFYTHNGGYAEDKRVRDGKRRTPPKPTKIKGHLWFYPTGKGHSGDDFAFQHPASFPEQLAHDHLVSWLDKGDSDVVVLDPFGGSGTVAKMATSLGFKVVSIDCSSKYTELTRQRIEAARLPLLEKIDSSSAVIEKRLF